MSMDKAEPSQDYDSKASAWKAKAEAIKETAKPAKQKP
jgi:hypothetical protein